MENEYSKKIVASLDKTIATGPWDKSLFLQAMGEKLQNLRHDFVTQLDLIGDNAGAADVADRLSAQHVVDEAKCEVFVSLYNADGNNLSKWQRLLINIGQHTVNRPIYTHKSAIQTLLRYKENKSNEAYAVVNVKKTDIVPSMDNQGIQDCLGQALTTILEDAIQAKHVTHFVHISGYYKFINNTLIRAGDVGLAI